MSLNVYLIIINAIGLVICYLDKVFSIKKLRRISEDFLLFICFIGGCFGFLMGMNLFRHKTKKLKFKLIYLVGILWVVLIIKLV